MFLSFSCIFILKDTDCRSDIDDKTYNGTLNVTKSGYPCRTWSSASNLTDGLHPLKYQNETLNYCRTPKGDTKTTPWCYTNGTEKGWEMCDVPLCGKNYM